jgi:hypothetical protein
VATVSDEQRYPIDEARVESLAQEFRLLTPEDQELVMILVNRLRGFEASEFTPDVPFMDFDE